MCPILSYDGKSPQIDKSAWVAENATVTGKVTIGSASSVWFQSVIRGDANQIFIGNNTNIQDGAIVHGTTGQRDTHIGNDVTIGHRAIIHGCTIEDNVLIGMGAIILDDVVVKSNVIVGAGAVVTQRTVLESGYIYGGVPAKKIKVLDIDQVSTMIKLSAQGYVAYAKKYKDNT